MTPLTILKGKGFRIINMADNKSKIVRVLNVPFSVCPFEYILDTMMESIRNRKNRNYISITNTESMYHAIRMPSHFHYVNRAAFSCCDGIGIAIAGKMSGYKIPRFHGPDLMLRCCEYGIEKKWRHFFFGGRKGIPELLSNNLAKKLPRLITSGTYSPPFRDLSPEEDQEIINYINNTNADILWVGLGLLKQERWIADHLSKTNVPWMIGVGAAFDFHAGTIRRAPRFFRHVGLEWLYRLAFEPRMFIRNIYSFSVFFQAMGKALSSK